MTAFTESAQPTSHYLHWQAIPSGRWLELDEVRTALGTIGITDTAPGVVDACITWLEELGYLKCSRTVESRPNPDRKTWEDPLTHGELKVIVPRYRKVALHEVQFEIDAHRAQQEVAKAAEEARAAEDKRFDAVLRRRGLTLPVTPPNQSKETI
jgi:hypothetical protein